MTQCREAPLLRVDATYGDVLKYTVDALHELNTCRARHEALITWIEEKNGAVK
jgi:hypothetical protein